VISHFLGAGLWSQLAIADSQLRQTEDLLRQADEKMASLYPDAAAFPEGLGQTPSQGLTTLPGVPPPSGRTRVRPIGSPRRRPLASPPWQIASAWATTAP
jgi:hypothetical protein